jgi:hypothetical protein
MQSHTDIVVVVVFHGTWCIIVNGDKFGSYSSQEEASLIARTWAENAIKQGRCVRVLIDDEPTSKESIH